MAAQEPGGGRPILVIPEETIRKRGRDAQRTNIAAAQVISDAVRTTLGPKGMDKMLVSGMGDVTITNDGATLLNEMDIEHPAAKMIVEVAETQDDEVGDGTTTAVIIAGELLKETEKLLDQDIHSSVIVAGYRMAAEKANEILEDLAEEISIDEEEKLKRVAMTAMTGKSAEASSEKLASLAVRAIKRIAEKMEEGYVWDSDDIGVQKQEGKSLDDSSMVEGVIIDKERVHPGMPKLVKDAKIALINAALEVEETEADSEIQITSPDQLKSFMDEEEKMLREIVEKIKDAGASVVMGQKGIDDMVQHFLAQEGIFAIRRVKKSDMEKLARATGGRVITNVDDLSSKDLGEAGIVEERKISGEEMTFIEDCKDPKAVSILIRGGTEHVVDEAERSMNDAVSVVGAAVKSGKIVPGGGASEIELALSLQEYSEGVGGREALAIGSFANAVETVVRTLAENAGLDPIDTLLDLRAEHEKGNKTMGVDVYTSEIVDMVENEVLEPLWIKTQAIKSGSEAAEMISRIDDVVAASKEEMPTPPPGGGAPGGAPGMPPSGGMY